MTPEQLAAFLEASQEAVAKLQEYEQRMLEEELPEAAKVFAHLSDPDNLRQSGLIVTAICKGAGVPFRKTIDQVERVLGQSLADLLRDLVVDIGLKLRTGSREFQVMDIPKALGISYSTFRTYCQAKLGTSPKNLPTPPAAGVEPASKDAWERLLSGELTGDEEDAVRELIRRRYPEMLRPTQILELWLEPDLVTLTDGEAGASVLLVDGENAARRFVAERVWPLLDGQTRDAQKAILSRFAFASPVLFDFLHQKAREEGRSDRQKGIDLAELAVLSLEMNRKHLGERFYELLVSGWAWVGNANVLAFKFPAAERAFERCGRLLKEYPRVAKLLGAADVYELKGKFRMFESKYTEAAELLSRGLEITQGPADIEREARLLMTIAANYGYAGIPEKAIPTYKRVVVKLRGTNYTELLFFAEMNLVNALSRCGQHKQAKEHLNRIRIASSVPAHLFLRAWVEAYVESGLENYKVAESRYLEAREGFAGLNDAISCACIDLDYAILLVKNSDSRALEVAIRVCPVLESYRLLPQTLECLGLLRRTLEKAKTKEILLQKALCALKRDPLLELRVRKEPGCFKT